MAVADPAVKASPPPPPPRIVVAVLVFVRFVLALMLAFGRVLLVAARAVPYLGFATAWVLCAGLAATLVARRVCSACSGPAVFLEASLRAATFKASICIVFLLFAREALLLYVQCLVSLVALVSGSGSEFNKSAFGAVRQESTQEPIKLPRAAFLGYVAALPFILLVVAGTLVLIMSPPVEGSISQGQIVGSVIMDVGSFGIYAISCFVTIPALALDIWRNGNWDRKVGLTVADCSDCNGCEYMELVISNYFHIHNPELKV
ncbi:unnamed protein product [Alopecurus aequalis]